jgi:hypothetical protein
LIALTPILSDHPASAERLREHDDDSRPRHCAAA